MSTANPPSQPISSSKTAALARLLDSVPKGYSYWTNGSVAAAKLPNFLQKFHDRYGVACSPAQRITRKKKGVANTILAVYIPEGGECAEWLLLATEGTGLESESLQLVNKKPRLEWLGYELVRHAGAGKPAWTWRRPKGQMEALYTLLAEQTAKRHSGAIKDTLERIARQPGFHGVREQGWSLFQYARSRGYQGELPFLAFLQKVGHGQRVVLSS